MNPWNNLLKALDAALGFPNRRDSTVKKLYQGYDNRTNQHVIWLQYRVRVNPGDRVTEGIRPGSLLEAAVRLATPKSLRTRTLLHRHQDP